MESNQSHEKGGGIGSDRIGMALQLKLDSEQMNEMKIMKISSVSGFAVMMFSFAPRSYLCLSILKLPSIMNRFTGAYMIVGEDYYFYMHMRCSAQTTA